MQRLRALAVIVATLALGAGPLAVVRVDDWESHGEGRLSFSGTWQPYPRSAPADLKYPPAILLDDGRRVLRLKTDHESVKIGRAMQVDVAATPWLTWEWKALILPQGGDVRQPRRNDQAARVMLMFEGMKAIVYIWDTTAPVGHETSPDGFGQLLERVLVVVRSGESGLSQWHRERRNVLNDYERLFEAKPGRVKWVGLESHSDDARSESAALFGAIRFDVR